MIASIPIHSGMAGHQREQIQEQITDINVNIEDEEMEESSFDCKMNVFEFTSYKKRITDKIHQTQPREYGTFALDNI